MAWIHNIIRGRTQLFWPIVCFHTHMWRSHGRSSLAHWRVNLFSVLYLEIRLTVFVGHSEKKKKSCTWYLLLWCQYCSSVLVSRRVQNNLDALLASRTLVWYWALDKCASAVLGGSGREPPYRVDTGVIVWKWPCVLPLVTCLMLMVTSHHWPFPHNYPPAIYQIGFFFFSRLASILKVQVRCSHDRKEVLFCGDGMVKKKKKRILSIAVWPNDLDFCLYICSVFHIFVLFQNLFDILQWISLLKSWWMTLQSFSPKLHSNNGS